MLGVMGACLSYKALAFVEDIEVEGNPNEDVNMHLMEIDHKFDTAANNCYIAVGMYAVTFLVSLYHWYVYHRRGLC